MEKKSKWIYCKDKLPSEYQNVLFVIDRRRVFAGRYEGFNGDHNVFRQYGPNGSFMFPDWDVLCWMPFPKAPEVDA